MKYQSLAAAFLIALVALIQLAPKQSSKNLTKVPSVVPHVDLDKFLGTWYEQSSIPFYFERNCEKTTATYSMNADKTIRVDNSCVRNGKKVESVGKAFPDPADTEHTNAKLKVEFSSTFDIKANYWIVRLAQDYSYSVISDPSLDYLWILSRIPHMDDALYNSIYTDLKNDGFPVDKLKKTIQ